MIYHIYWGTGGNSGLYLHEIYQTLKSAGFEQKAFVNYYFPFDYGEKVFFKRGNIAFGTVKGKLRKVVMLFEVLKAYQIILHASKTDRPKIINYSHVGSSYFFIPLYLKLLKRISGAKLMITCHDTLPHSGGKSEMVYRKQIFQLADYLLVHTDTSADELVEYFDIDRGKIVKHLFPIMDLSKVSVNSNAVFPDTDFLFIGHLRKDKGVDLLMDAWKQFHKDCPEAKLRICGKKQPNILFKENDFRDCNVEFNMHFISDDDYFGYVKSARYVILPYLQGTNSGIISTVLSLGTNVITSDIPMFKENPLVPLENMFRSGDVNALVEKLKEKWIVNDDNSRDKMNDYINSFNEGVIEVYTKLYQ